MKKIISVIITTIVLLFGTICSYAAETPTTANIELELNGPKTVNDDQKTVELFLHLGAFTGVEENVTLGYQGILEYDKDMFSSVMIEGLNTWNAEYASTTKKIVGDVAHAKSNTDIVKITLTLKDGIESGTTGKVTISNILLSNGTNDFSFNKEITITKEASTPIEQEKEKEDIPNNEEDKKDSSVKEAQDTDKTTASAKIPKAGITNILIIVAALIILVGIISLIRYKNIKLK